MTFSPDFFLHVFMLCRDIRQGVYYWEDNMNDIHNILKSFEKSLDKHPEEVIREMIESGKVSADQVEEARMIARKIIKMM